MSLLNWKVTEIATKGIIAIIKTSSAAWLKEHKVILIATKTT
jgi:hypothetical protein